MSGSAHALLSRQYPYLHPYFRLGVGIDQRSAADNTGRRFPWSGNENDTSGRQWISLCEIQNIFEGTEQIQQLVISRAISGMRIQ